MTIEELTVAMGWIPIRRYCQITGEKRTTLHQRRVSGAWVDGVHLATPKGGCTYVNIHAVRAWCEANARPVHDVPALLAEQVRKEIANENS